MSRRIVIDSWVFASERGVQEGEVPVASLVRLHDLLTDLAGRLHYRIEGLMGPRRRPRLLLNLWGSLPVRCQRCLQAIDHPVEMESLLEFVDDEEELTQEEIEDDSLDFLPAEKEFDVLALIEDEIILGLPSAPRHENCALPDTGAETGRVSPFAALEGFKVRTH